jgi:hypothetical protein
VETSDDVRSTLNNGAWESLLLSESVQGEVRQLMGDHQKNREIANGPSVVQSLAISSGRPITGIHEPCELDSPLFVHYHAEID